MVFYLNFTQRKKRGSFDDCCHGIQSILHGGGEIYPGNHFP